jgi:hypothetical protein
MGTIGAAHPKLVVSSLPRAICFNCNIVIEEWFLPLRHEWVVTYCQNHIRGLTLKQLYYRDSWSSDKSQSAYISIVQINFHGLVI